MENGDEGAGAEEAVLGDHVPVDGEGGEGGQGERGGEHGWQAWRGEEEQQRALAERDVAEAGVPEEQWQHAGERGGGAGEGCGVEQERGDEGGEGECCAGAAEMAETADERLMGGRGNLRCDGGEEGGAEGKRPQRRDQPDGEQGANQIEPHKIIS